MGRERLPDLLRFFRRGATPAGAEDATDDQLLNRFLVERDEGAFELLVRRHGAMVMGTCRRVLGDAHEAEDAFQATFLVLARKAALVARRPSAGGWLHTVAYRVALHARGRRVRRVLRERPLDGLAPEVGPDPADASAGREALRVLDEEVGRLPEKYRVPFVLCYLEGRSNAEAARELGCKVGTLESWLVRARERLRARLSRRGFTPSHGLFAALAPVEGALPVAATVRAALGTETVGGEVGALTAAAVRALVTTRARVAVAVLLLAVATATALAFGLPRPAPFFEAEALLALAPAPVRAPAPKPAERPLALVPVWAAPLKTPGEGLNAVALHPADGTLATAVNALPVNLWRLEDHKPLRGLAPQGVSPGLPNSVHSLAFSRGGGALAAGSGIKVRWTEDGEALVGAATVWDAVTWREKARREFTFPVYAVAFSPDGQRLACAGGIQPAATRKIKSLADLPPKEDYIERGRVHVWDLVTGDEHVFYLAKTGRVKSVAYSPDGKLLAGACRDGAVRVWDAATGKERACLRDGDPSIHALAFSPDGRTLATAPWPDRDRPAKHPARAKLWDVGTWRVRAWVAGHAAWVKALAFSPDGKLLVTAADFPVWGEHKKGEKFTGEVRLWSPDTGASLRAPLVLTHRAAALAFGRDGHLVVGGEVASPTPGILAPGKVTLLSLGTAGAGP